VTPPRRDGVGGDPSTPRPWFALARPAVSRRALLAAGLLAAGCRAGGAAPLRCLGGFENGDGLLDSLSVLRFLATIPKEKFDDLRISLSSRPLLIADVSLKFAFDDHRQGRGVNRIGKFNLELLQNFRRGHVLGACFERQHFHHSPSMANFFATVLSKKFCRILVVQSIGECVVKHVSAVLNPNQQFSGFEIERFGLTNRHGGFKEIH